MAMDRRGSAGGRANEGGSLYRASFGAYLIACGLADQPVWFDPDSPGVPQWLWFESDAPVDDLAVQFSNGARWDIQATAQCTWSAKFRKTTAQWVRAVRIGRVQPDDRVGLAAARLSQPLQDLGASFRRVRDGGTFTPRENDAMAKFRDEAKANGWLDVFDQVTKISVIVQLDCATELDQGFREAAAKLEATAVSTGSGVSAMKALRDFVHAEAARAGSSRSDRWIKVLADVPIVLGPSAPRSVQVRTLRMAEHRRMHAEDLNRLPLNFLGLAAEPLRVEDLLDRFRVELPGTGSDGNAISAGVAEIARRWPAFCVLGAAGGGKSTAMQQLAAAWARDVDAPVPVVVPMHRLITQLRAGERLSLLQVVEHGLGVDAHLAPALEDRLRNGSAALLLDGLDECRDQQDAAVQLIRRLAEQFHSEAGLVVSARDAVAAKAAATGLPVTTLQEPHHLASVAKDILALVASATRPDHGPAELAQAQAWLARSQAEHPDMWKVPLFAALLAAHAGRTPSSSLPSDRANALVAAIQDSVRTWEQVKQAEPTAWLANLTPAQLIDGFTAIGHATARGSASRPTAVEQIVEVLKARWGMAAAAAQEQAEEVLAWWIGRVGAFSDRDGEIRPSLRLFGEIGDAMWASRQAGQDAWAWMENALTDVSQSEEPVLLAASLSETMRTALMRHATTPAAVLLASKAIGVGIEPSDEELLTIAERLLAAEDDPTSTTEADAPQRRLADLGRMTRGQEGPTWRFRLALAQLPPRGAVADLQASAVELEADPERRLVLRAFAVAAQCELEARPPTAAERDVLHGLLDLPAPKPGPPSRRESRRKFVVTSSPPILSGRVEAMAQAMDLVGPTADQAKSAVAIAERSSMRDFERMLGVVQNAGFPELLEQKGVMAGMAAALSSYEKMAADCAQTAFILEQAAEAVSPRAPGPSWRLGGAAALFEVLALRDQQISHVAWAIEKQPRLVTNLVRLAMQSPQLDAPQVAADSGPAALIVREGQLRGFGFLTHPADPRRSVEPQWPDASEAELSWLWECSESPSEWLALCGVILISGMAGHDGDKALLDDISRVNVGLRRRIAATLLSEIDTGELQTKWLEHPDQLVKAAAARVLAGRLLDPPQLDALVRDADLTIRFAALRGVAGLEGDAFERAATTALASTPTVWTCEDCGTQQAIAGLDCGSCSRGCRSEMTEELKELRGRRANATKT